MRAALLALAAGVAFALPTDVQAQAGRATGRAESGRWERESRTGGVRAPGRARGSADRRNDRRDDRHDRDRWDRRDDRRDRDRWDRRDRRDRDSRRGPAFCRDGRGHPVYGRSWCHARGWDTRGTLDRRDRDRDRDRDRWDRVSWGDVIFRRPNYRHTTIGESILRSMLGDQVFLRLDGHRQSVGYAGGYTGSWRPQAGGYVLMVNAGGMPLAQLIDANGDGRAETVMLRGQ